MKTATTGIAQILEGIAQRNGGVLTPEEIVEAARPEDSPLHDNFEWEDKVAAELHRLDQARHLIRSVRYEVMTTRGDRQTVRRYVSTSGGEGDEKAHVYRRLEDVRSDPQRAAEVLSQIESDWQVMKRKWALYSDLLDEVIGR